MSILSVLEATPNRVRSLARLVALLECTSRDDLRELMMPGVDQSAQFNNLLRETIRLELVVADGAEIKLGPRVTASDVAKDEWFREFVEEVLFAERVRETDNADFRYALAWLLSQAPVPPLEWNADQHLTMQGQMTGDNIYDVTNASRFAMLSYWARFLGYASSMAQGGKKCVVPDPTEALAQITPTLLSEVGGNASIETWLSLVQRRCPVLEGGRVRSEVEQRFHVQRAGNALSAATSLALWRLRDRGVIALEDKDDAPRWLLFSSAATPGAAQTEAVTKIRRVAGAA